MTPTRFTSLILFIFTLMAAPLAHADDTPPADAAPDATPTGKAGVEWPRTFSGQPDFAFTREEVLRDAKGRTADSKEPVSALMPTLKDLLDDNIKFDPLNLSGLSSATTVSGTDVSGTAPEETLMSKLLSNVSALPTFTTSYTVDIAEFTGMLNHTISTTVSAWQPGKGRYTYGGLLSNLTLQAIVTSPEKYAIINGQRYAEGDSFQLKAPISVPDTEIITALQNKMPPSGTVPSSIYQQYQAAYEDTLASFSAARDINPDVGRQTLSLPVIVESIQPRLVKLNLNGEEHDLTIKFAY